MKTSTKEKYEALKDILRDMGSVAVAFSSGVDSTLLLKTAHDVLGGNCIAVTAKSCTFPERERKEAAEFCACEGVRHIIVESEELEIEGFAQNPKNRCYLCKHGLFEKVLSIAAENGAAFVAEGSNMDDLGDYRPGLQAIAELEIRSPLREAGLYKEEIREISKELGLSTWDKPAYACLSSRFVYGETITREKLKMVERAEELLQGAGFRQVRVRIHGENLARIEVQPSEIDRLLDSTLRTEISSKLKGFGFAYVTLDLAGYRMGSMNEVLDKGNV